ncbi:MAG: ATP-binding protein [Oxalobacter sp.]|nr:ATP-binding protein [Oxalobacter sp.]
MEKTDRLDLIEQRKAAVNTTLEKKGITLDRRLEILEEGIRKKYLSRLTEMRIAEVGEIDRVPAESENLPMDKFLPLEDDLIENIRLYRVKEIVYLKEESITDKFNTVFSTLSPYNATVFVILDSDGEKTRFYIGVRNNELDDRKKPSTVMLGDTLKNSLVGHFPGIRIEAEGRRAIGRLSRKIASQHNVASVSVVGDQKIDSNQQTNAQFVQGLEKLAMAMAGRCYTGIIIAESQSSQMIQTIRKNYQDLYTKLSPLQKVQFSENESYGESRNKSFFEMDGKEKTAMIGSSLIAVAGSLVGTIAVGGTLAPLGAALGAQIAGQLPSFINSLAPNSQITKGYAKTTSTTTENRTVTELLELLNHHLRRLKECDSYGMWNAAGYFVSDDMSTAEIAASNYRSLMSGKNSGEELSAINVWRGNDANLEGNFWHIPQTLSRFVHPQFFYGVETVVNEEVTKELRVLTNAATALSGRELALHLGLPRASVPGLPVIEHAELGKEVNTYESSAELKQPKPEDSMSLGWVFDLGNVTDRRVTLSNKTLNMHTFVTGSTGSGKSNAVYQMLNELRQDQIPFLVIEPAKGEYKDVFGHLPDINVYSTNPKIAPLINLNPFRFPDSIHVLEHVDGLVEIFSVCWPMYDAMPAFFKDAILKSYEAVGWDLGSSTFEGEGLEYPDFEVVADQLVKLISESSYSEEIKSNYRGALITRVKSLTVGLNKFIFTSEQTPYEKLFDENCILDISRVKSSETKALLMGLMVYILNEYRMDRKEGSNRGLKHITVLEEAHNLLKNTSGKDSELIGKSVEMLTQTIAEIRTYGEGFIIVDQSPSSVDIAAIKNTNTKIILRTPEKNDREAAGRSIGLTDAQVNEIARLPTGVAVVYQNNWINPVLTKIDKASVREIPYENKIISSIMSIKTARTNLLKMVMQAWFDSDREKEEYLMDALKTLELSKNERQKIAFIIKESSSSNVPVFSKDDKVQVAEYVSTILDIKDEDFYGINSLEELEAFVRNRIDSVDDDGIDSILYLLTFMETG